MTKARSDAPATLFGIAQAVQTSWSIQYQLIFSKLLAVINERLRSESIAGVKTGNWDDVRSLG